MTSAEMDVLRQSFQDVAVNTEVLNLESFLNNLENVWGKKF